jgi:16S rRNA (cytosine967-C5)-methyltransferase
LRTVLREQRGLPRNAAREISRAVFAYYRWQGWRGLSETVEHNLVRSQELADRFANLPERFYDVDLERAVPEWTRSEMNCPGAWLRALQSEPRLWLRAKRGQGKTLAHQLGECWIPPQPAFADAVEYQGTEDLFRTPEFHAGEFELQDIASQAVGLLCDPQPGETWWDACAGEGGKTLHLSDLMQNKGLIWASDRAEWRLKKLKLRARRAGGFNYRMVLWDGGAKLPTKTKFDGVLVDAPCSGVGTWQRNPHARWTTTPEDVHELSVVQLNLLASVAPAVKSGGKLIYSVCTLTRAETTQVADAFTAKFPDFEPVPLVNPFEGAPQPRAYPLWLWPQDTQGNGMFVAAWQRK